MKLLIKVSKMTCPLGQTMIDKTKAGEASEIKVLTLKDENGRYNCYAEEIDEDHLFGFALSLNDGTDFDALEGTPDIKIVGLDKPTIIEAKIAGSEKSKAKNGSTAGTDSEAVKTLVDQKIAEGIITQEFWDNVRQVLDDWKVVEYDRIRIVKQYRAYHDAEGNREWPAKPAHVYVNVDDTRKHGSMYDHSTGAELLNAMLNHQPIVCEGDKSTGKSVAVKTAAWVLGMPLKEDTYSDDMLKNDPLAFQSFDDRPMRMMKKEGAEAYMMYMADPVRNANYFEDAREYMFWKDKAMTPQLKTELGEMGKWAIEGGVYVANEANLARVNIREALFNPAAEDNDPHITIPGMGMVRLNPDCVLIVTQNRDYAGTNGSNDAIDSRFGKLKFPNAEDITHVLRTMTESDCGENCLQAEYYKRANALYTFLLGQVHDGLRENSVLSIRSFGKALKDVALGGGYVTLHSKLLIYLQSMTHSEEEDRAIADDIHQFIGTL